MSDSTFAQSRWSLVDLFPGLDAPELETAFTELNTLASEFEKNRSLLNDQISSADFHAMVHQMEDMYLRGYTLSGFASLAFSADTQDQKALTLMARIDDFLAELSNTTIFFSLWWKSASDETAERLMQDAGDYRYWLEEMRHFKPYTLSEAEEKVLNIKNVTGANALGTLYDSITTRYVFKLEVDGEMRELTRGELMVYARQADAELRARAYQELYRVYGEDSPILGQIYQTLVRDWRNENIKLRGFSSPFSVRNLANDLPDASVDTLLDVCKQNAGIFQRYFKLKARWLGMERLRRYDVYAPVAHSEKRYPFNEGAETVFEAFRKFDPRVEELAKRIFKADHLDSEVRKGKRGGAFCAYITPKLTPWVLLNYQGRPDDVATMAHELGHAVHGLLASDHSIFTYTSNLPLAETASTFGEMLLVDHLLKVETDAAVRRDLLFRQVDDAYATILRQAFFALFERQAHEMVLNNASVDELAEAYLQNLREQFGDSVDVSDEFRWEWVSIPHIYQTPFYVYAYSFGQLLVLSLYQQYKREGDAFKPRYFKILSTGGAKAPVELLREAGIDISQASFWQGGFDVLAELVSQLESLPIEK